LEALLQLFRRLLSKEQRRFIKFCVVGTSGIPVNLLCTWAAYHLLFFALDEAWRKAAAYLFGIAVSTFTNFLLNDLWTWRDREKVAEGFLGRMLRFYLVSSVAAGIQFGTAMGLTLGLDLHYLLAQLIGIALATAVNFIVNNIWTFRGKAKAAAAAAAAPPAEPDEPRAPSDSTAD
jgi:putative flippase GtrA